MNRSGAAVCLSFLFSVIPLRAEPGRSPCLPWMGTARVWTTYDESNGTIKPMSVRECGGIPKGALSYAQRCIAEFGNRLTSAKHVIIGDFSTDANFVRLHVLEWNQQDPEASIPLLRGGLAHGAGNQSDSPTGVARVAKDEWNSNATPGGCMRLFGTGNEATIPTVLRNVQAYRLDGLEERNACAAPRGIYFHESYLAEDGRDMVQTRRIEEIDRKNMRASDFGRIVDGRHLGTALTAGCVTASNDDFDFIKASGVVPPPGANWTPASDVRQQEGILFVSWFWGDNDDQALVSRYSAKPRSCFDSSKGLQSPAIPRTDAYQQALKALKLPWQ